MATAGNVSYHGAVASTGGSCCSCEGIGPAWPLAQLLFLSKRMKNEKKHNGNVEMNRSTCDFPRCLVIIIIVGDYLLEKKKMKIRNNLDYLQYFKHIFFLSYYSSNELRNKNYIICGTTFSCNRAPIRPIRLHNTTHLRFTPIVNSWCR